MALLTVAQMKTHIYTGVQNLISQGDNSIIQDAINAAMAEAKGYCSRYDLAALFDNTTTPDPILQMHVKNMAKWHFMSLGNAAIDYDDAKTRYDQAIAWLKGIQKSDNVQPAWPLAQPEEIGTYFHVKSEPKRKNHY